MKAVIYTRFSSSKQREESTEGQIRVCRTYAEAQGLDIIKIYSDEAKTGRNDNRTAFQQMLRDSDTKAFSCVLVYARDRFARNIYEDTMNEHRLKKNGVDLISVTQPISSDPEGVLMKSLIVGMSEYYSLNLSRAVKRGMKENALKGKSNGGNTPTGYKLKDGQYVIDELYAPLVQEIFRRVADGETQKAIIDDLNSRGYRTRQGNKFNKGSLHRMLANRKYLGNYVYDGDEIEGGIPRLIDEATWKKVQTIIGLNSGHYKAREEYLLYNKIYCDKGHKMLGESATGRTGTKYTYYKCKCKRIKKDPIEELVADAAVKVFMDPDTVKRIAVRICENYNNESDMENSRRALEGRIAEAERKINNLVNLLADTSSQAVLAKLEALEEERDQLKEELAFSPEPIQEKDVEQYLNYVITNRDGDYKKNIISALIYKVIISEHHITVVFNTSDETGGHRKTELSVKDIVSYTETNGSPLGAYPKQWILHGKLIIVISV